ncbi:MAG: type VI secretion system contractile sheath small subunit [Acidobacteriota bacterium]
MPKRESIQQKISRIRPPRVHITYDVEVGGAIELKELPFVVGVLGDFSGKPAEALGRVRDRKFVQVDRDSFDQVLAAMKPRLAFQVENRLSDKKGKLAVELNFRGIDDFHPDQVVQQVEELQKLVELRQNLSDLLAKMDGNDKLTGLLQQVLENPDSVKQIAATAPSSESKADEGNAGQPKEEQ